MNVGPATEGVARRGGLPAPLRIGLYLVVCGLGIYLMVDALIDASDNPERMRWMLSKDGAAEWVQAALAAGFAVLCLNCAMGLGTSLHTLLTLMALGAMVAELEDLLESVLASDMPRRVVQLFGLATLAFIVARWRRLKVELRDGLQRPGLLLMLAGFIVHVGLARMLSKEQMWEIFASAGQVDLAQAAVRETIELAGYLLLLCGAFEERFGGRMIRPAPGPGVHA